MTHKPLLKTTIKITVSGALLVYLLVFRVHWHDTLASLHQLTLPYFILALSLTAGRLLLAALRWHLALVRENTRVRFPVLLRLYAIASFFNLLLPTAIGGDLVRVKEVTRFDTSGTTAISSALSERVSGLISLIALAACSLFFLRTLPSIARLWLPVFVIALLVALLLGSIWSRRLVPCCTRLLDALHLAHLRLKVDEIHRELRRLTRGPSFLRLVVLSLGYQLTGIVGVHFLALSLGLSIPLSYLLLIIPLVYIATMIPVSVGGLGVREELFVFFLVPAGIVPADALALSLVLSFQLILLGVFGAFVYLWHSRIK